MLTNVTKKYYDDNDMFKYLHKMLNNDIQFQPFKCMI